jgi:hypothetical protein
MNTIVRVIAMTVLVQFTCLYHALAQQSPTLNGFVLEDLTLPLEEMFIGGPDREKIKAIDKPEFISVKDENFLSGKDLVVGVVLNGVARAYPARILNHHELVNDQIGKQAVAITYSPLSGTAVAYLAESEGEQQRFGVSSIMYNNNTLLYDQKTKSLWAQAVGQAVSGDASGQFLQQVPTSFTTWDNWKAMHPNTQVLSRHTGFEIDYAVDPYAEYETSRGLQYPINKVNKLMPLKEKVIGVEVNGSFRAYPMFVLQMENKPLIADTFNGLDMLIRYDKESKTATITNVKGEMIPTVTSYWFAWYAFHPNTDVYMLNDGKNKKPGDVLVGTAAVQR